jgi:large subunit ribosomal protein L10e|tara:strand:- start:8846 stop:9397 length:552 start_codon:yes stop_codon:yes gene_type:complete
MAALRKANAYSKRNVTPFTRVSKKRQKSYIKTVPQQKIVKFTMGNVPLFKKGKFPHRLTMISTEKVQLRHNALEACRQYINKKITNLTNGQYFFKVIPFPHHIQRENKMITGAGADRMQTGMQLSYGKSAGKAAILKNNSKIFEIYLSSERFVPLSRKVLKQVNSKLPGKTGITYEKISKKAK